MYQFIGEFCEYTYVGIFKLEKLSDFLFLIFMKYNRYSAISTV